MAAAARWHYTEAGHGLRCMTDGSTQHQSANAWRPIKPLSKTGAELLFRLISQHYERGATIITSDLPFDEWTGTFGEERLSSTLLDRLTHHVHTLEMNGQSYRLAQCRTKRKR